jgi:hypothetical protein
VAAILREALFAFDSIWRRLLHRRRQRRGW